jgi:hypothetical protein
MRQRSARKFNLVKPMPSSCNGKFKLATMFVTNIPCAKGAHDENHFRKAGITQVHFLKEVVVECRPMQKGQVCVVVLEIGIDE